MTTAATIEAQFGNVAIADVVTASYQPRQTFEEEPLSELAESIKQFGINQPLLFRPAKDHPNKLELVAGERRLRAAILAGLSVVPGMVKNLSDEDAAAFRLIENMQRQNVPAIEEAEGIQRLMDEFGLSVSDIEAKLGKKRGVIYNSLKLLDLSPDARAIVAEKNIPASTALLVARIPVAALQEKAIAEIAENDGASTPMSNRDAKHLLQQRYMLRLDQAPFKLSDAKLCSGAGSCNDCRKRTSNAPEDFPDVSEDLCTDPDCFEMKGKAVDLALIANAKKKKLPIFKTSDDRKAGDPDGQLISADHNTWSFVRILHDTPRWKSISELLSSDELPVPAALQLEDDDSPTALYRRADIQAALESKGLAQTEEQVKETQRAANSSPARQAQKAKLDMQEKVKKHRELVAEKTIDYRRELVFLVQTANKAQNDVAGLLKFACKMLMRQWNPSTKWMEAYGMPKKDDAKQVAFVDGLSDDDLRSLLLDLATVEITDVYYWQIDEKTFKLDTNDRDQVTMLENFCAGYGIDLQELRVAHAAPKFEQPEPSVKKPTKTASKGKAPAKKAKPAAASEANTTESPKAGPAGDVGTVAETSDHDAARA